MRLVNELRPKQHKLQTHVIQCLAEYETQFHYNIKNPGKNYIRISVTGLGPIWYYAL